jgi:beta-N-acetylhexosaminidase
MSFSITDHARQTVLTTRKGGHVKPTDPTTSEATSDKKVTDQQHVETPPSPAIQPGRDITRWKGLLLLAVACIVIVHALNAGALEFIGPQGWASTWDTNATNTNIDLLKNVDQQLRHPTGTSSQRSSDKITPQQYINTIVENMTLDMKLGQMLIVQFVGPDYSSDLHVMLTQYHVGAVLIFAANQNIVNRPQLQGLIQHMQQNSQLPLAIAIDQEGGYVNRLVKLNGPRPTAAAIGASDDPQKARAAGTQDAQDLASYGINLNLAPVIDVDNNSSSELHQDQRTYGNTAARVTQMAAAYLQGLQQSGKVLGTLKHFPGLGSVTVDPHVGVAQLTRSKDQLEQIDWQPYRALLKQGNVHAIMVTHEVVTAIDPTRPSTLSAPVVTGVLRDELHYQGVIMTDSLTMQGIIDYTPEDQAAALAVEAGSDLLMGASTPRDVASMIAGMKEALRTGALSEQHINASVQRILMMKYEMGLLSLPDTTTNR